MGGGGGGKQPTQTTSIQTNIPEWAKPYATQLLGQAQALTDINQNPYVQYGGQREAGFSPLQQQAFQGVANLTPSAYNAQAAGIGGDVAMQGMGAGAQYNAMATNPGAVGAFMSPYMQNVVDRQKQGAIQDYSRSIPGMGANAARAGALGGTRNALVQAEAQRGLYDRLDNIQAQGLQNAYGQGLQSMQFGSNLGLQGLGLGLQGAGLMGNMGAQQFSQQAGILDAQRAAGQQQQAQEQARLDRLYQDFTNEQNYPYRQLGFMSDILRGTAPLSTQSGTTMYQAQPSTLNQLTGAGMTAYGLGSLFKGG